MAEFLLDRFKYRWRGDWSAGLDYKRDDIVRVGGKSYVCLIAHTASSLFRTDLNAILPGSSPPQPQPKWVVMTSGRIFLGNWETATDYNKGDIVLYQGSLYECITSHLSNEFGIDAANADYSVQPENLNWKLFVLGQKYIGNWTPELSYGLGTLVKYGGQIYICVKPHHSTTVFEENLINWNVFYDGDIYLGPWQPSTKYVVNDLVKYGASIFKCIITHESDAELISTENFELYLLGSQHEKTWEPLTVYNEGDIVRYGGTLYYAINPNVDSPPSKGEVFDTVDSSIDWIVLAKTYNFRGIINRPEEKVFYHSVKVGIDTADEDAKETGNFYVDGVENGSVSIRTGETHIFDQSDETNVNYFAPAPMLFGDSADAVNVGLSSITTDSTAGITVDFTLDGVQVTEAEYISNFSSAITRTISLRFTTAVPSTRYYFSQSAILMGGSLSIATAAIENGYTKDFLTGDIVQRGGDLYYAVRDVNTGDGDLSSIDYEDPEIWERLATGKLFSNNWQADRIYSLNEVVVFQGTAYIANIEHRSTDNNFPGDNGSGYEYWDTLVQAGQPGALLYKGDLLTYGLSRSLQGDGSTLGDARLAIGEQNQVLSVSNELEVYWRNLIDNIDTIYVGTNGVDNIDQGYGFSMKSPFKTVRYACEYVEDNYQQIVNTFTPSLATYNPFTGVLVLTIGAHNLQVFDKITIAPNSLSFTCASDDNETVVTYPRTSDPAGNYNLLPILERTDTTITVNVGASPETSNHSFVGSTEASVSYIAAVNPVKIFVATGRYEEVGPITVPAGCVVMGDELRSTAVVASRAKTNYASMYSYAKEYVTRLKQVFPQLILLQNADLDEENTFSQDLTGPVATSSSIAPINTLIDAWEGYLDFRLASGDEVVLTGSNTATASQSDVNAAQILLRNKEVIAKELILYTQDQFPGVTLPEAEMRDDILHLLRGMSRDLHYSGNYMTVLSARRLANSVEGCQLDDLFWMRDTTGLRSMTTDGLEGVLNPPGVFEQYQRPTGGSCVALDPGWGPADQRVWINFRSPYIQGVTNLGTACVGKRVDGSLHNGGNRSMVSNDFTQVLSDGIGAYISNNARAELVSVFTYYCQVGYLAENGGVIRATNGNNSYGSYGSIAQGNDPAETPQTVTVNNRQNEAQVSQAIAGGANDEFIVFEYNHCGEQYKQADATIVGAGADVQVEFSDFRDGALANARLITTAGSGNAGGSNYLVKQNSAQANLTNTQIILNINDTTQFDTEILGMRIIIISGTGVGQYGIINGFTFASKTVDVIRESDGEPGWDHVLPGTPIAANLDATTNYRIEPRIYANKPAFTEDFKTMPTGRSWIDIAYGGTTATYANITLATGTGRVGEEGPFSAAIVNVDRAGDQYSVSLVNDGAGYAVNDELTILGSDLGGTTPENDIVITVTANSDDSTNSIVNFTFTGTPRGNRFVAIADTDIAAYSDDGETWLELNLPFAGEYKRLIAADNRFIALPYNNDKIAFSYDGQSWIQRSLPSIGNWTDIAYGLGRFVIIGENEGSAFYSGNGLDWSSSSMPTGDDSAGDQWQGLAYGQGRFVAVSGSQTKDVAYSTDGINWNMYSNVLPTLSGDSDYLDLVYGANRFLAFSKDGEVAFSLDLGETWTTGTTAPTIDGSTIMNWKRIKYGQGVFFAICDTGGQVIGLDATEGPTTFAATTEDGILWTSRTLSYEREWGAIGFSNYENIPNFYVLANNETNNAIGRINCGCQAKVRANVVTGSFTEILIWDPGSGYTADNDVELFVVDNQFVTEVEYQLNRKNKVLAQPDFINRGTGYRTTTSTITIAGDGFAEIVPEDNTVILAGLDPTLPGPGVQIRFANILDDITEDPDDLKLFIGVGSEDLGDDGSGNGTRLVRFTISPGLKNFYNLEHGVVTTLFTRYSQCRITGHDFLDIGTGNFEQTNYPELYAGGAYFTAAPENEVTELEGGRVFYVSTDQDGNFRGGELFGVNQATGVVTISAEFFDLDGLSELSLGGVRLGGTGTIISEFSTDPTFSADSNNIIPTQKAIATFLADRLSVGGSDLETNSVTAGAVKIGTENNTVEVLGDGYLNIPRDVTFTGADALGNVTNIQGSLIAQMMFLRQSNSVQE